MIAGVPISNEAWRALSHDALRIIQDALEGANIKLHERYSAVMDHILIARQRDIDQTLAFWRGQAKWLPVQWAIRYIEISLKGLVGEEDGALHPVHSGADIRS